MVLLLIVLGWIQAVFRGKGTSQYDQNGPEKSLVNSDRSSSLASKGYCIIIIMNKINVQQQEIIEKLCENGKNLYSPVCTKDNELLVCSYDGHIHRVKDGSLTPAQEFQGDLNTFCIGSNDVVYVSEISSKQILVFKLGQAEEEPAIIVSDFEGEPFIGISSMALSKNEKYLYITDSGSFAETSIQNPKGSLYEIDLEDQNQIRPIIHKKLSFPTGLVVSQSGDLLYLCETLQNRILRVFIGEDGNFITSVFHQFQGRLGPISMAINKDNLIFVSIFEYSQISKEGLIQVLSPNGQNLQTILVPDYPEINGMFFSQVTENTLFVTENSSQPMVLKMPLKLIDGNKFEDNNEEFKI